VHVRADLSSNVAVNMQYVSLWTQCKLVMHQASDNQLAVHVQKVSCHRHCIVCLLCSE